MYAHRMLGDRRSSQGGRRGMTLIELVVVMVILVAMAGILIPTLTGMSSRAHTSSGATNLGEIAKAIQTYEAQYIGYPNNFDSLVTDLSAATLSNTIVGRTSNPDLTTTQLSATSGTLAALQTSGITSVTMMSNSGATTGPYAWSPTFYPYAAPLSPSSTPLQVALADGSTLAGITGVAAAREFGAPATASYILLGVGKYSSLSKVMLEAPMHFDDDPAGAPTRAYARYAAVFQITDGVGTAPGAALDRAKFVGVVGLHADQVAGMGDHLGEYWNLNK